MVLEELVKHHLIDIIDIDTNFETCDDLQVWIKDKTVLTN